MGILGERGMFSHNLLCDRLGKREIAHYWPQIEGALDEEPELWNQIYTKEQIAERLEAGQMQAFAVADTTVIRIVFFTQVFDTPIGERVLQLWWMKGEGIADAIPVIDSTMEHEANRLGCSRLEITGRIGWKRLMAPFGVQHLYSVYGRPVRKTRDH